MIRKIKYWRGLLLVVFFIQAGLLSQWITAGPVGSVIAAADEDPGRYSHQAMSTLAGLADTGGIFVDSMPVADMAGDDSGSLLIASRPDYHTGLYGLGDVDISEWAAGDRAITLPDINAALKLGKVAAVRYARQNVPGMTASIDSGQNITAGGEDNLLTSAWMFFLVGAVVCGISLRLARY